MALQQVAEQTSTGGTSIAIAATDFTGANFLAAIIVSPTGRSLSSFVDSTGSNSWLDHPDGSPKSIAGTSAQAYCRYVINPTVTNNQTFTATFSATDIGALFVIGLSGRATASPISAHGYAADSGSVTSHTGGATGGQGATDDLLGLIFDEEGTSGGRPLTYTATGGWTLNPAVFNSDGRLTMCGGILYQTPAGGTGSIAPTWTTSGANTGAGFILAVKPGSADTPAQPPSGTLSTTGIAPNAQKVTNTVLTPVVARRGGQVLDPDRRIIVSERRIFLPSRRAA